MSAGFLNAGEMYFLKIMQGHAQPGQNFEEGGRGRRTPMLAYLGVSVEEFAQSECDNLLQDPVFGVVSYRFCVQDMRKWKVKCEAKIDYLNIKR